VTITVRRVMVALSILGIILASYLVYVHYSGTKPVCSLGTSCIKVQTSQWSKLAGVPVALMGLIGYIAIVASLLAPDTEAIRTSTLGMTLIGFAFSGYLTYRELFSIHAICEECATSAVFMTLLFGCALWRFLRAPTSTPPRVVETAAAETGKIAPVSGRKKAAVRR
jgi:uncharacterized membrane protein